MKKEEKLQAQKDDMIKVKQKGDFSNAKKYMTNCKNLKTRINLDRFGREGVVALSKSTPRDSGLTASCWTYTIEKTSSSMSIAFHNTNIQNGVPIAIILQYGHGTGTGGYVQGRDYINPAIRPVFDELANEAWKEVTNL